MTIILGVLVSFQLIFSIYLIIRLISYETPKKNWNAHFEKVSILICAKNEAENLKRNLPLVLSQKYPDFEVIVIDDASTDDTKAILNTFKAKYNHLVVLNYEKSDNEKGKKPLLEAGIKLAKGELLLMTDADCQPINEDWISKMVEPCQNSAIEIVLGYSPYYFEKKNLLNRLIQHETTRTAFNYFSFAAAKFPYMGVGRNILYRKRIFDLDNPFETHKHLAAGDDDLTINALATKTNTAIQLDEKSWVLTFPPTSWKELFRQKLRHYSVSTHYKKINKFLLFFQLSVTFSVLPLSIILLFLKISTVFVLYSIIIWLICTYFIFFSVNKLVKNKSILIFAPFLEIVYYIFLLFIAFLSFKTNKLTWKK